MTSSRQNKKTSDRNVLISDYDSLLGNDTLYDNSALNESLPPKAKSSSQFVLKSLHDVSAISKQTAHDVDLHARKVNAKSEDDEYVVKYNKLGSCISEIEAAIARLMRFYCRKKRVASTRALYDENKNCLFHAVASKKFKNADANSKKPLRKEDILIEFTTPAIENERDELTILINDVIAKADRTTTNKDSYFTIITQGLLNYKNSYNANAGVTFATTLKKHLEDGTRYTPSNLDFVIKQLQQRKSYIISKFHDEKHKAELICIEKALKKAHTLDEMQRNHVPPVVSIPEFEEFSKRMEKKQINLAALKENSFLTENINGRRITLKVKNIINYRNKSGHGVSLTMNKVINNVDVHNCNMTSDGRIWDFDMAKFNITYRFKFDKTNYISSEVISRYKRKPTKDKFKVTAFNIRNFPDISVDPDLFYWPTIETRMSEKTVNLISLIYDIRGNLFKPEHTEVYKLLKNDEIFEFHKYKTLLKYILTDYETIKQLYSLDIRKNFSYIDDDGKEKNLLTQMIEDEMENIKEYRAVLITMPEFRTFMDKYGDEALRMINEEYEEDVLEYSSKLKNKPYYENLFSAISISKKCFADQEKSELENRYDTLRQDIYRHLQYEESYQETMALSIVTEQSSMPRYRRGYGNI